MTADVLDDQRSATDTSPPSLGNGARRRRWIPLAAASAVVLAVGIGAVVWFGSDDNTGDQGGYAPVVQLEGVEAGAPLAPVDAGGGVQTGGAVSPEAAVGGFLDAEVAGDPFASFAYLSTIDQEQFGSPDSWETAHDDLVVYEGYEIVAIAGDEVEVDVRLQPAVDLVLGVVPAAGRATFVTVDEGDGWRVAYAESTLTPAYPDDALAVTAASAWVAARQACDTSGAGEYGGSLLGELGLAEGLCGRTGTPAAASPRDLDALADPSVLLSAFGDQATEWTRVVRVDGIDGVSGIDVILAPFADTWVVVGAVGAR